MANYDEKETLTRLYGQMYKTMIAKDTDTLRNMMAEGSALIHTWSLRLDIDWAKKDGKWLITEVRASTY